MTLHEDIRQFEKQFISNNWRAWRSMDETKRAAVKALMREGFKMHTAMFLVARGIR